MMTNEERRRSRFCPNLALLVAALAVALMMWLGAGGDVRAQSDPPLPPAPAGVTAVDGTTRGAVTISWNAVASADFYRIGWVKMDDIPAAQAAGRHWLDAFAFTDVANLRQTAHTLTDLRPGSDYAFIVGSVSARFGQAAWSEWAYLTPAGDASCPTAGSGSPSDGGTATPPATDRAALVALYNATGGDNWHDSANWMSDKPLGQWHGVTTDKDGRVIGLQLDYNGLDGTIPTELGDLNNLRWLWLNGNELTGAIPAELGNLTNLRDLHLRNNRLTGVIPTELGNLIDLRSLQLGSNVLTGPIPAELGSLANLRSLQLGGNVLTGQIPAELGNLDNLHGLSLDSNQLTGMIPAELGNLDNLQTLHLDYNQLTGAIPAELGNLDNLHGLSLDGNQLTGTILPELGNLDNLQSLYLGRNRLAGCIPQGLSDVPSSDFESLALPFCDLTSNNPMLIANDRAALVALYHATGGDNWKHNTNWLSDAPLGQWHGVNTNNNGRVVHLRFKNNRLTGAIPAEIGKLTNLEYIDFSNNRLTSMIPKELGNFDNLHWLWLHTNQLTGTMPAELGNLYNLQSLNLHGNALTGAIPAELDNLDNLQSLYLGYNRLIGCIPQGLNDVPKNDLTSLVLQFCDLPSDDLALIAKDRVALVALYNAAGGPHWNDNSNWLSNVPLGQWHGVNTDINGRVTRLYLDRNQLTGAIPAELGNLTNLRVLYLDRNHLTGAIPVELGNLTNLGVLRLDRNHLTGAIPAELGNLTNLLFLSLDRNQLTGSIPAELGNLTNLRFLPLSGNQLTGCIPQGLRVTLNSSWRLAMFCDP